MRIGLITDVHSHPKELARALALFRSYGVDQVVTLGDTIDAFAPSEGAAEVAALLLNTDAVGVWGNHDCGLRGEITDRVRARFSEPVLAFMARMSPRLVVGDCHFSHREASVDPYDSAQLWGVSDTPPDLMERARLGFDAVPQHLQFVGHYHRWWAATPSGVIEWDGNSPLVFDPKERYFVIVGAGYRGWCALLDLEEATLLPLSCGMDEAFFTTKHTK